MQVLFRRAVHGSRMRAIRLDRRVREHYGIVDGAKEAEASDDAKQAKAKKKADTEE